MSPFKLSLLSRVTTSIDLVSWSSFQSLTPALPPIKMFVISPCSNMYEICSGVAFNGMGITLNPNDKQARSTKTPFN